MTPTLADLPHGGCFHISIFTSMFFALHPLTDIPRAILELYALGFATRQKSDYLAIHQRDLLKIYVNVLVVRMEELLQLRDMGGFNPPDEGEKGDLQLLRSFDPETHYVFVPVCNVTVQRSGHS